MRFVSQLARVLSVAVILATAACDSGPRPGQEGAYWGQKLVEESTAGKKDVALKHLQELKAADSIPFLYQELKQPISEVRAPVVELLGLMGDKGSVEPILGVVDAGAGAGRDRESKLQVSVNEKAIKALVRLVDKNPSASTPAMIEALRKLSRSSSLDVQLAAIFALGELKATDAVDELIALADGHTHNFIVKNAAEALTKIGDPRAAEVLGKLMFFERDGVSFYRESSWGLFLLGKGAMPTLDAIYKGTFKPIEPLHVEPLLMKTKAVVVYGDLAEPSTFERIIESAQTEGSTTAPALLRIEGQRAAGRIGLDKVAAGLKKQMDNVDISQSEHALAALVQMGTREIAGDLWKITTADGYMKGCLAQDNAESQCKFNELQVRKARLLNWSRIAPGSALGDLDAAIASEKEPKIKAEMEKAKPRLVVAKACEGKAMECYTEKLKDENATARERAAYELLWTNTDASRDVLLTALTDKDNEVRYAAIMGVLRRLPKDGVAIADTVKAQLDSEKGQTQYIRINEDLKRLEVRVRRGY